MRTKLGALLIGLAWLAVPRCSMAQTNLCIVAVGKQTYLSWSADTNAVLQSTTGLAPPNWVAVSNLVSVTASNTVTVTLTNTSRAMFFRLYATNSTVIPVGSNAYIFGPESLSYGYNVTNNGGTIDTADLQAIDEFIVSAKSANYYTDLLDVAVMAGNSTNSAVVKLKNFPGSPINLALSPALLASYYSRKSGWTNANDGSARWLDSGVNIGTMMTNSSYGAVIYSTTTNNRNPGQSGGMYGGNWPNPPYFGLWIDEGYFGNNYTCFPESAPSISAGAYGVEESPTQTVMWNEFDSLTTNGETLHSSGNNNDFLWLSGHNASGNNFDGSIGFAAITDGLMGTAKYQQFMVNLHNLMINLGRDSRSTLPLWAVPVTGQSLALGATANFAVSTNPAAQNIYTTSDGPIVYAGPSPLYTTTGIVPCRESGTMETPCTSWMNEASALGLTNVALYSAVGGVGGTPYTGISNGTPAFVACASLAVTAFNWVNYKFPSAIAPAVIAVHGESDTQNPLYQADLMQWVSDYTMAFQAATGQTNGVKMFHSQPSAYPQGDFPYSPLAMYYESIKPAHSNILACAKYTLEYSTNMAAGASNVHLDGCGYQQLGEYYGKAFYQEMIGGRYDPVCPNPSVYPLTRTNYTVYVPFVGVVGNLVFETNNVCKWGTTNLNWGFTESCG